MNEQQIRQAFEADTPLEYHVTGGEVDPHHLLPTEGWYPCTINWIETSGNVEITMICPNSREIDITVLSKNTSIAFRQQKGCKAK